VTTEPLAFDLSGYECDSTPALHIYRTLLIDVYGRPITQGSKTKTRWGMYDDNEKTLRPWRVSVQSAAEEANAGHERIISDVRVTCLFHFDRPQSHYGTGRNASTVKTSAPKRPTGSGLGDLDKLERAIYDALTDAGVWRDDCQVASSRNDKVYVSSAGAILPRAGVRIIVEQLP
jgi:crossover junction endodeoxyribonuclease RusA